MVNRHISFDRKFFVTIAMHRPRLRNSRRDCQVIIVVVVVVVVVVVIGVVILVVIVDVIVVVIGVVIISLRRRFPCYLLPSFHTFTVTSGFISCRLKFSNF